MDPNESYGTKYVVVLQTVLWAFFNTSFTPDLDKCIPGKFVLAVLILVGDAFNILLLVVIVILVATKNKPTTKYFEICTQLEAYMQKKQFPEHHQNRIRFYYEKKFHKSYYEEEKIKSMLSGN